MMQPRHWTPLPSQALESYPKSANTNLILVLSTKTSTLQMADQILLLEKEALAIGKHETDESSQSLSAKSINMVRRD